MLEHGWRLYDNFFDLEQVTPALFVVYTKCAFVDESVAGVFRNHLRCYPRSGSLRASNHNSRMNC